MKVTPAGSTWFVKVDVSIDATDDNLQYVARVSAYNDGNALGTQSRFFTK